MAKADLKIDWATHEAAKYACENWHYSKSLPVGEMVKIGVWEKEKFVGVVIFSWGANKSLGSPYGLNMIECCELVRVAMRHHITPVSRINSLAIKFLKSKCPDMKLVISFADPSEGHHGGIYQAGNWIYSGKCSPTFEYRLNGKRLNKRAYTGNQFGKEGNKAIVPVDAIKVTVPGKHRYLMPLDGEMRARIMLLAKPYPKRAKQAMASSPEVQRQGGTDPHAPISKQV